MEDIRTDPAVGAARRAIELGARTGTLYCPPMSPSVTLDDPLAEARRVVALGTEQGLRARLLGGLAIVGR